MLYLLRETCFDPNRENETERPGTLARRVFSKGEIAYRPETKNAGEDARRSVLVLGIVNR